MNFITLNDHNSVGSVKKRKVNATFYILLTILQSSDPVSALQPLNNSDHNKQCDTQSGQYLEEWCLASPEGAEYDFI